MPLPFTTFHHNPANGRTMPAGIAPMSTLDLSGFEAQCTFAAARDGTTLGVVGSLDLAIKPMQALKELRPDITFVVVEGVPHSGPNGIQAWPGLAAAVKDFIERHP